MADYVNQTDIEGAGSRETKKEETSYTGRRRFGLVGVCFGLLCVLQATLNISLRLIGYSNGERGFVACNDTLTKPGGYSNGERGFVASNDTLTKPGGPVGCVPGQVCPQGWKNLGSGCYFLSTEKKTWEESRQDCKERGADLVVINNREEQEHLYDLENDKWLLHWIGLSRRRGRFWTWVDGTRLNTTFWQAGRGGDSINEACVEMYHHNPMFANWNDCACGKARRWLCERETCPPVATAA